MNWLYIYLKSLPFLMRLCMFTEAHSPSTYQIVFPSQVSSQGQLISNLQTNSRKRRSIAEKADNFYLNITGDAVQFQLKLKTRTDLLAPGFRVYVRNHDNNTDEMDTESFQAADTDCIFSGELTSHDNRQAYVSLCEGVTGVLRLENEDYIIEPLPEHMKRKAPHDNISNDQQPHILYKTTDLPHQEFRQHEHTGTDYSHVLNNAQETNENQGELRQGPTFPASLKQTVETLVVADKALVLKHGRHNVTTYVLSIFNIVSKLFQDNTLGKPVEILLVGLVLLESDEPGLHITHHADSTLNSFCQWQSTLSDATGRRHDHAILLTGLDICSDKNAPCDTLGFAPISGMCNPLRSCVMSEDTGLATAFTVAHEIGHNLGMFHDGDGNDCKGAAGNIMSPILTGRNGFFQWSSCSRDSFLRFLNTIQSNCLSDRPDNVIEFKFPKKLPGELYDAATQCKWLFGSHAKACSYEFGKQQMCKSLWCYKGNKMCETKFLPAAEGTDCGVGMWCRYGKCEKRTLKRDAAVDGGWSPWTSWSACSRTCGGGIKHRNRKCNNPKPKYNGKSCQGDLIMYSLCNTQLCSSYSDFRSEQCKEYDKKLFRGWLYKWKAYTNILRNEDQCKLYCQAENYNFFFALSNKVKDGTVCSRNTDRICVQGLCKSYGCDLVVDSLAVKDVCGICQGDNSTCTSETGFFKNQIKYNTYHPIVTIPAGATSIRITNQKPSANYIALKNKQGQYYLNGNRRIENSGTYVIDSRNVKYENTHRSEEIYSDGPFQMDIVVELLSHGYNYGIYYEYFVKKTPAAMSTSPPPPLHLYTWITKLTTCSQTCAGGFQNITVHCYRDDNIEVSEYYCDKQARPEAKIVSCVSSLCPPRWEATGWSKCSRKCGGGKQRRKVRCWQKISSTKDRKIRSRFCKHLPKPSKRRRCNDESCPPKWHHSKWSQCSTTCGRGFKTRKVFCEQKSSSGRKEISESFCRDLPRPSMKKICHKSKKCPAVQTYMYEWLISSWGKCSATCNRGVRMRIFRCSHINEKNEYRMVPDKYCTHIKKPDDILLIENCLLPPCLSSSWSAGPWSQCSVTCGDGVMTRRVHCTDKNERLATDCNQPKPPVRKRCRKSACFSTPYKPLSSGSCQDKFDWCPLVPFHKICSHTYYGNTCCQSCLEVS